MGVGKVELNKTYASLPGKKAANVLVTTANTFAIIATTISAQGTPANNKRASSNTGIVAARFACLVYDYDEFIIYFSHIIA